MDKERKEAEWIYLNDNLLEAVQINIFHSEVIPHDNKISMTSILGMNSFEDILLFFSNFSREYLVTHLAKIIDSDSRAITIQNFFIALYPDRQGVEYVQYKEWKKATCEIREKIREARNRYSSHSDRESIRNKESFGLCIDDLDNFLHNTFVLFDFLYKEDGDLKKSFDNVIGKGLIMAVAPTEFSEKRKLSMAKKIKDLRVVNK